MTMPEFVELVRRETRLSERLRAAGYSTSLLDSLVRRALAAAADGLDLRAWMAHEMADIGQPPEELPSHANAIQLLTCQKSKGLEWPVVICFGLARKIGQGGRNESYPKCADLPGATVRVLLSSASYSKELKESAAQERDGELRRFLYVTMTR